MVLSTAIFNRPRARQRAGLPSHPAHQHLLFWRKPKMTIPLGRVRRETGFASRIVNDVNDEFEPQLPAASTLSVSWKQCPTSKGSN